MKKSFIYRGRKISSVGFFGLGKSNLALYEYLSKKYGGLSFTLRADGEVKAPVEFDRTFFGKAAREEIYEDVIFFSPSAHRGGEKLLRARKNGVIFSSDVEFFFENKAVPVVSVTGTDGKSTTTALTAEMLSKNGDFPASANIGLPMTALLEKKDLRGTVAELSSFQLMDFAPVSKRALITNISENHLDWHSSMDEYALAKENALKYAEQRVFNLDCPYNLRLLEKYPAFAVYSARLSYKEMQAITPANHYFHTENGRIFLSGNQIANECPLSLPGSYNLSNFLAAAALAIELCPTEKILEAAKSFRGLSHRITKIGEWDGISFYDSSIDSTPSRTLTTLSAISSPTVLILGGRGKALSYAPLSNMPKTVRAIVICGENKNEILSAVSDLKISITQADSFKDAVTLAIKLAERGDSVLLSPASTSFDSFSGYGERGLYFSNLVKKYYSEI